MVQNGREVYKWAARTVPEECNALLEKAGFSKDDLDWFVPHSANMRMIESICEKLPFPLERTLTSVEYYGNTSSVSIILALDEAVKAKKTVGRPDAGIIRVRRRIDVYRTVGEMGILMVRRSKSKKRGPEHLLRASFSYAVISSSVLCSFLLCTVKYTMVSAIMTTAMPNRMDACCHI